MRVVTPSGRKDAVAQSLEQWGHGLEEGREDRQTGRDDADVAFDVEPYSQINEGVS